MAKKKKAVIDTTDMICSHCLAEFVIKIAWCPHCLDHHEKGDMDHARGWCKRCVAGLNEEYIAKRAARPEYVAVNPESYGNDAVIAAYVAWMNSPAYEHRFDTLGVTPGKCGSDAERDAIAHERWINDHFAGL